MSHIQIMRPSNSYVLAKFEIWHDYNYRFPDGGVVPLEVQYAWCHQCDMFVEAEHLYTEEIILQKLKHLDSIRGEWMKRDAEALKRAVFLEMDRGEVRTCEETYDAWQSAIDWLKHRKSPPRCLECGSVFAVVMIPESQEIAHPNGDGEIIVRGDGTLGGEPSIPQPVYFDLEGLRLKSSEHS